MTQKPPQTEVIAKRPRGRPSIKNDPNFVERIMELARAGKTEAEIAENIGVDPRTIRNWKVGDWLFSSYLRENKEIADELVEVAGFKRATGYDYTEEASTKEGIIELRKHAPPDPSLVRYWLNNRRPKDWKERVELQMNPTEILSIVTADGNRKDFTR